jgi:hypothetical protein
MNRLALGVSAGQHIGRLDAFQKIYVQEEPTRLAAESGPRQIFFWDTDALAQLKGARCNIWGRSARRVRLSESMPRRPNSLHERT